MKNVYDLGDKLVRAYNVIDADNAEMKNLRDIEQWWRDGLLTDDEYHELIYLNKRLHSTYCNI